MRLLKKLLLLLSCVTRVRSDACDVGASRALAETTLVDSCDSEACVCAALMLGKLDVAKAAIVSRLSRGEQALRVRAFAVARHDAAVGILARVHPRYPRHLKSVPALLWAQTNEAFHLRIRFARYTSGEAMARHVEHLNVSLTTTGLHFSAESAEMRSPAFFETTIEWLHPLARADGCTDTAENASQCAEWATQGECASNPTFMAAQCALSCGACGAGGAEGADAAADGARATATWALVDGELVIEARKAVAQPWARPLLNANPANRILFAEELGESVGQLLRCVERCAAGRGDGDGEVDSADMGEGASTGESAGDGEGAADMASSRSSSSSSDVPVAPVHASRWAKCRASCEVSGAARPVVYDGRPPRVAAGRATG